MDSRFVVLVGLPGLMTLLTDCGQFTRVVTADGYGALKSALKELGTGQPSSVALLIAPRFASATEADAFTVLIPKMQAHKYHTILVGRNELAEKILAVSPSSGLLKAPFTLNSVIGGIAGKTGWALEPSTGPEASVPIDVHSVTQPVVTNPAPAFPAAAEPKPPAPAPAPEPVIRPKPAFPVVAQPPVPAPAPKPFPSSPAVPAFPASPSSFPTAPAGGFPAGGSPFPASAPSSFPTAPAGGFPAAPGGLSSFPTNVTPEYTGGGFTAQHPTRRRRGYVIAVVSPKGGVGKSALSVNLAAYLAMRLRRTGRTVALLDANMQQGDVSKMLGIHHDPTIKTLVDDPSLLRHDQIVKAMHFIRTIGLSVMNAPLRAEDYNLVTVNYRLYSQVLAALKENFDYIIIDSPVAEPHHEMFSEFILPKSDYLIAAVTPARHTLANALNWLNHIQKDRHQGGANYPVERIGVLLNQMTDQTGVTEEEVRRTLAQYQLLGVVDWSWNWARAANEGELVATNPNPELARTFNTVLYRATGRDPELVDTAPLETAEKKSGLADMFNKFRKGRSK